MNRNCQTCQKTFHYPRGANHAGKYCSRLCMSVAFRNRQDYHCQVCATAVTRTAATKRSTIFCSNSCYSKSLRGKPSPRNSRVSLTCVQCESSFTVKQYRLEEGAKFCSQACSSSSRLGGKTTADERVRRSAQYKQWRTAVFERDNYTCVSCGQHGGYLNADHIKTFAYHPELRFDLTNGRTLCVPCHKKTDTYGFKAWRGKVDATGY